jgi:Cu+-exporting ATPase
LIAVVAFALAPYYTGIIARNLMTPNTQASAVTADAPATIAQAKFTITGMTCGGCADTIKAALEKTAGVRRAEVSYERGEAIVDYDPKVITPEKIRDVINQTGFKAEIINNNSENQSTTKSGGQLTVINGSENSVVLVRSTRFRCAFCVTRVVDALKVQNGVEDVGFDKDVQPLTLRVRFDPQKVNPKIIGESAKQALETDPYNTAPVEVIYK